MPANTDKHTHPLTRTQVLDRDFLQHRARLLDIAAYLDRLDRAQPDASSSAPTDPRITATHEALKLLIDNQPHRARRLLELMSDPTTDPIDTPISQSATGVPPIDANP